MINSKHIALMTLSLFFILSGFASCKQTSEETDWTLPDSYYEKDTTSVNPNPGTDTTNTSILFSSEKRIILFSIAY